MPHTYNLAAFRIGKSTASALVNLYCSLVTLELALKDARGSSSSGWDRTHDVPLWITEIQDPTLNSLAVQLSTALSCMQCTLKDGTAGAISPKMYPAIRYLRHEIDFPGTTTDTQIESALLIAAEIEKELKNRGVLA